MGLLISLDGVVDAPDQWHFPYFNDEMGDAVDATLGGPTPPARSQGSRGDVEDSDDVRAPGSHPAYVKRRVVVRGYARRASGCA